VSQSRCSPFFSPATVWQFSKVPPALRNYGQKPSTGPPFPTQSVRHPGKESSGWAVAFSFFPTINVGLPLGCFSLHPFFFWQSGRASPRVSRLVCTPSSPFLPCFVLLPQFFRRTYSAQPPRTLVFRLFPRTGPFFLQFSRLTPGPPFTGYHSAWRRLAATSLD